MIDDSLQSIGILSSWVLTTGDADDLLVHTDRRLQEDQQLLSYLRSGTLVFATMRHTWDVAGDAFGCPGGAGILTDGRYFWRGDAANYVEYHGVKPSDEFLDHVRTQRQPPHIEEDELRRIDAELSMRRSLDRDPS